MDQSLNVLLIEDSEDDALLVLRVLKQSGFTLHWQRVETASTLEQALIQRTDWDVIISDYRLPGFNAHTALEIIKQHQLDLPFIVVSGTIGETTAVELMRAGAQDYLMKDNLVRLPEAVRREVRDARIRVERHKTTLDLAIAQERLQLAIEGSDIGIWDWDIKTGKIQINDRCAAMLGYQPDDIDPLHITTLQHYGHPDDKPDKLAALVRHFQHQTPTYECEFRLRHRQGHWVWVLDRGRVVEWDNQGRPLRMAGTSLDISDRKQAELRQSLQNAVLERIAQLDTLPEILDTLVRIAEAHLAGAMGSIMVCDRSSRLRYGAAPHLPTPYSHALDGMLIGANAGSCGTAAFCREVVVVPDIATDPLWQDFKDLALHHGLRACWSAPAISNNNTVLATCSVYFSVSRQPQPQELDILTLVADIAKIAIERHQATAALAKRDRYLGALVEIQQVLLAAASDPAIYQKILQTLGPITEADRIYIFENHTNAAGELFTSQRAEWCPSHIQSQVDNPDLYNVPYSQGLQRWQQVLSRGDLIQGAVADFPESERAILEAQEIKSLLVLPLIVKNEFWGFIGVDNCVEASDWHTLERWLLSSVAAALVLAKERELVSQALTQLNRDLENRIAQRTAALQKSEAKLQAILNFAPAMIYVKDLEGRHTLANHALQTFLGVEAEHIIGKNNDDLFSANTAAQLNANDRTVLTAGQIQQFEEDIIIDNRVHTLLSNKFLLFDHAQQPYALCGISADITERKIIQEKLRRKEAHLRHIATNIPGVIFQYAFSPSRGESIAYISERAVEVFELDPVTIQTDSDRLFELVHPEDLPHLRQTITQAIQQLEQWTWEGRIITPSGQQKWIQGIAQPERRSNGSTLIDGLLLDISDRKEAEILLQQTNAELARATRLKDEFLANMSHELRTPLNAVLGIAEGLEEGVFGSLNERQLKAIDTISESGQHLLDLINDILDFSKIEAGKLELFYSEVAVHEIGEASLRFVQHQAFKKQIDLSFNLPQHLQALIIKVDQRRLRQALINLLNNAVKFTPNGGQVNLTIRLEIDQALAPLPLSQEPNILPALCFVVTDTGIGIAPENLEQLFKSFVQIDSCLNRQYDGTGLGLALVKRLTHLHGGSIGVSSTPGLGSCFAIRLPCTLPTAPVSALAPASESPGPSSSGPLLPLNALPQLPLILLLGHVKAELQTFASYLEAKRYRVLATQDEQQMLHLAQTAQPDLLLFDSVTSTVDKTNILHRLRHDRQIPFMPIIVLTELVTPTDRETWLKAGVSIHLTKPVKLKVLAATIEQLLNEIDKPQ